MAIIQFKDVWEMYRIKFIIDGKPSWENFWALKGVTFEVEKGESLGIIGENGAGKSTLLKLIAGIVVPDRGEMNVTGKASGLLELGAGFQPELTGKENIYFNANLFGLSISQIEEKYEEIVNFANIGKFIHAPIKCYSQGMFVRLAFAIAVNMDTDVLLIDDTLSVGDQHFQRKCIKRIFEIKEQGKTIIFVTHDMNMLTRLCKRAIFLKEGRIIKDGLTDKVVPFYAQMVGSKEGTGVLERKQLALIFNNGRMFLNWQDKLLTPNSGAYVTFLIKNKWYSSIQAEWDVEKENENKLVARGVFYQLALTQIWRLEITDNYDIKWDIEIESDEALEIQEACTNIMLTNEYRGWFTALEKGKFLPVEYEDQRWQPVIAGNISSRCIGVETERASNGKIPSLVFKRSNYTSTASSQIFNTDYLNNCRVLQYKELGLQNYSATQADRFVYFSGRILIDIPDIEVYLKDLEDEFILSNGGSRLIFDNGQCAFSYDGIALAKAGNLGTAIYVQDRWYYSIFAHWDVKKQGKDRAIVTISWPNLPLSQTWEIKITGDNSFYLKVDMKVRKELNIEQQHFYIIGCREYTHWFSKYATGEFPGVFLETEMDMVQRCIPDGEIGLISQDYELPALSMKFSNKFHNFAKILNSNFYSKTRILRIEKIEPEENIKLSSGLYPCFDLEIAFDKDKQIPLSNSNMLQGNKLNFIFDKGSGRIFWEGKELTKRLGLYTSLRSEGRWHDSSSKAIWKTEEGGKGFIKATGKWLYLPIIQSWEIRLQGDRFIEFNVKMKVDREIEVERLQTNLMLSEAYSQWVKDKEKHFFPEFKDDVDDDWDIIYSGQRDIQYIGVAEKTREKSNFPSLTLIPRGLNIEHCVNVINSDVYHRGRVLQYLDANQRILSVAEYSYFSGTINIGSPSPF